MIIDNIISDWKEEINDNTGNPIYYFKVKGYFATEEELEDDYFAPESYELYDGDILVSGY